MNAASALITAATSAQKELVAQGKVSIKKKLISLIIRIRIITRIYIFCKYLFERSLNFTQDLV